MKKTLALLIATSALTATLGLPVWSAVPGAEAFGKTPMVRDAQHALPLLLASNDDNDGNDNDGSRGDHDGNDSDGDRGDSDGGRGDSEGGRDNDGGRGDDQDDNDSDRGDDNDNEGGRDDDGDDGDDCNGNAVCRGTNPAPAGSVPPPQNGLFNNGTAPKVQVN